VPDQDIALNNFSGGQLSPLVNGRFDLAVARNGMSAIENFFVQVQGGIQYRPGTPFVNHTRLNQAANLVTFQFNDIQAYVLEFTDKKIRFYRNEGFILETATTITGITNADPGVVTTSAPHGYSNGDEVFITGVVGMSNINGKTFLVANVGASTFELTDIDSNNVDTTSFGTYSSAGTAAKIFEIDSPYQEVADLFALDFSQTADTMYFTHPFYEPRQPP